MAGSEVVGSLQDYDVVELLVTLAASKRSGWFEVHHPKGLFRLAMHQGRPSQAWLGGARNEAALALLLSDQRGGFVFRPGDAAPGEAGSLYQWLLSALRLLPVPELIFDGAAKWNAAVPSGEVTLSRFEKLALTRLSEGATLGGLAGDPTLQASAARLARLGLLIPRTVRVARLTLSVWHGGGREAVIDERVVQAWENQLGVFSGKVIFRTQDARVMTLPVNTAPGLGVQLLLSPQAMVLHELRGGETVLVRPE
ncbi:DUF4388 domain-containing protein [Deinococcus peraridilitoris]|uniref:PatA-like N-terminal domain-containing protein n=1 Tax=Deinococcus peraridilitoris (strain DSM 19664 / LMG 22246 / CIP 109416 / KR-200) TaxID=937777 RepID=L0A5Y3_DEIPD|nr:DUF4388 domain-containing protein [Deinococcus peraridilitoris]AFZ68854.1 hypothetical protein Deipe_3418 [Deinococcus peraridilitoris DSM 19664]